MKLYTFSVERIYRHPAIERYKVYCERIIERLFDYLVEAMSVKGWDATQYERSPVPLEKRFGSFLKAMQPGYQTRAESNMVVVRDYVAGMTDGYALRCMREISLPDELSFDMR